MNVPMLLCQRAMNFSKKNRFGGLFKPEICVSLPGKEMCVAPEKGEYRFKTMKYLLQKVKVRLSSIWL